MENIDNLIKLALEQDEDAKNKLYDEYKYIVDILIHKYHSIATSLNIEINELEQEAFYAFSDAINSYQLDKNAKLSTFISLCVDRRLKKNIKEV